LPLRAVGDKTHIVEALDEIIKEKIFAPEVETSISVKILLL